MYRRVNERFYRYSLSIKRLHILVKNINKPENLLVDTSAKEDECIKEEQKTIHGHISLIQ